MKLLPTPYTSVIHTSATKISQDNKKTADIKSSKQGLEVRALENSNVTLTCNLTHDYFELKWIKLDGVSKKKVSYFDFI